MRPSLCLLASVFLPLCVYAQVTDSALDLAFPSLVFVTIDVPGAVATRAHGINSSGRIVGSFQRVDGITRGFSYYQGRALEMKRPGTWTESYGINDSDQVVGTYLSGVQVGFWFVTGDYRTLNLCPEGTFATGINDHENLVGGCLDTSLNLHGYTFSRNAGLTTLDYPGAVITIANGVNDDGEVVGSWIDVAGGRHGFLFFGGEYSAIDVPGARDTFADGINSAGVIDGTFIDTGGTSHGFLYRSGDFIVVNFPGAVSTELNGINRLGIFVGDYVDSAGVQHGFFGHR